MIPNLLKQRRRWIQRQTGPGAPPGMVQPQPDALPTRMHGMGFGPDGCREEPVEDLSQLDRVRERWPVFWLNVGGLGNSELLNRLGERFGIHRLALEDVVNVHQRPKVEVYGSNLFIVIRMLNPNHYLESEQISLFVGQGYLVSFQEFPGDYFDPIRERIRQRRSNISNRGSDYLAYALIDAIVDSFYPVLEVYGDRLEELEVDILDRADSELVQELHRVKRDLLIMRRILWPLRDAINQLMRDDTPLFQKETNLYLRDCHDHSVQLLDLVETYRELSTGLMDLYLSIVSNRLNDVMKVLTIIATIFIPISFVAGLYGMNFQNMPELNWEYGYFYALGVMIAMAAGMLVYFWKKGWLGRD